MEFKMLGRKEWLWVLALASLGIVVFCTFQFFWVNVSLVFSIFIVIIAQLCKDLGSLQRKVKRLEEELTGRS